MKPMLNIRSKGEITEYLLELLKAGQIKDCQHMLLDRFPAGWSRVKCEKEYASEVPANNVTRDPTGYGGPGNYFWPKCPTTCPHYKKSANFALTVSRDQYDNYLDEERESRQPEPKMPSELKEPPKYTAQWIWTHAHYSVWLWFAGLLITAAGLGFSAGRWTAQLEQDAHKAVIQAAPPATVSPPKTATPASTTKK